MYLRMVLRSRPVRRAIADTLKPWRARSRIMTSSPSVTTHALPQSTEGIMSQGRLHGSRASAPEPCRCVSLGNVHPPDLRSIQVHPHSRCKWPFRRACAFGCCMEGFDLAANFTEASGRGTYLHRECGRTKISVIRGLH